MVQHLVSERRAEARRRALMTGTIRFRTRSGSLSCVVRNISDKGAKLVVTGSMWLPERFELEIPHLDLRIAARAVWREATEMGIAFTAPQARARQGRSLRAENKVVELEAERARLALRVRQLSEEF